MVNSLSQLNQNTSRGRKERTHIRLAFEDLIRHFEALHDFYTQMEQGGDPNKPAPDLDDIDRGAQTLRKKLKAIRSDIFHWKATEMNLACDRQSLRVWNGEA